MKRKQKTDDDIRTMTEGELRKEVLRLRSAFRKELEHTGNHRCWINLLQVLPEGKSLELLSLPREEFLGNCKRYFKRNQPKKHKLKPRKDAPSQ